MSACGAGEVRTPCGSTAPADPETAAHSPARPALGRRKYPWPSLRSCHRQRRSPSGRSKCGLPSSAIAAEQSARPRIRIDFRVEIHIGRGRTLRPTGPVATEASAPRVNLPPAIPSMPVLVVRTKMMSEDCAPACRPQLPPVSEMKTGLLHGEFNLSRTTSTPLPVAAAEHESHLGHIGNDRIPYARDSSASGIC